MEPLKGFKLTTSATLEHNTTLGAHYRALAVDNAGDEHVVIWAAEDMDCDDWSNACDWSSPISITRANN